MIIRKPFAFLIKNFRKIHIVLLALSLYIFYKTIDTSAFVNEFVRLGTYDYYSDPVTRHISWLLRLSVLIMLFGSIALLLVLRRKEKPWKIYLAPIITYASLYLILGMIKNFFNIYNETIETTNVRLSRDLLIIFIIAELPSIALYGMRVLGIDIKKFNFKADLDDLELSNEDRGEIELSIDIDINTFKRFGRKFLRNVNYFYKEHKIISWILIALVSGFILYNSYVFIFITNKTYRQGQKYNANGYSFIINKVYWTDKDGTGEIISNNSNFVIAEITVTNNSEPRKLDTGNFHLRAGFKSFETTETTYANEFEDLGKSYSKVKELQRNETTTFIIIYKVDKRYGKNRFVMYYQEKGGIYKLRKIKLKVTDLRKISKAETLKMGDFFDVPIYGKEDSLAIDSYNISDSVSYKTNKCARETCNLINEKYTATSGYKVLTLNFASEAYEAKNIIDFLTKYGKINYKDSKGKDKSVDVSIAVDKSYYGKTVYLKVPAALEEAKSIQFDFIIRTHEYYYQLS